MKDRKVVNVVLSGGSGTRLWPLSKQVKPKQFLNIFDGNSLFQHTLLRNKNISNEFLLVTNGKQESLAIEQASEIGSIIQQRIIEPIGRNTAPAIALAAMSLDKDDILMVTPSDHMIYNIDLYNKSMERAIVLADQGYLVTFGVKPTNPNIGYGYIEYDGENVLSFREKPNINIAKEFLDKGNYAWNSGMFCFKVSVFLDELKRYHPKMYETCLKANSTKDEFGNIGLDAMKEIPEDSIDYTVLEKSDKIKMVTSEFYWTDLGSFDSIIDYFENNNKVESLQKLDNSTSFAFSTKNVYSEIKDIIIIETKDTIVVLDRKESNQIKEIYKRVKNSKPEFL